MYQVEYSKGDGGGIVIGATVPGPVRTLAKPRLKRVKFKSSLLTVWVVVKIMVPFWVPEILGAVL